MTVLILTAIILIVGGAVIGVPAALALAYMEHMGGFHRGKWRKAVFYSDTGLTMILMGFAILVFAAAEV